MTPDEWAGDWLLGSGEFKPWTEALDRDLLSRTRTGDGRVLILPTAAAPEGDQIFDMWAEKGLAHYRSLGIAADVAPLKTRADAADPRFLAYLDEASLVYFSGGNGRRWPKLSAAGVSVHSAYCYGI